MVLEIKIFKYKMFSGVHISHSLRQFISLFYNAAVSHWFFHVLTVIGSWHEKNGKNEIEFFERMPLAKDWWMRNLKKFEECMKRSGKKIRSQRGLTK